MSSISDDRLPDDDDDRTFFGKWVSLTYVGDMFDIDCDRVRCEYSTSNYMATFHVDVIVLVPSLFRCVSQMVAHTVLSFRDRSVGSGLAEIVIRRPSIRCGVSYQFAYVDGLHYEVMGVSKAFTFHHRDRQCDCSSHIITATGDDIVEPSTAASSDHPDVVATRANSILQCPMDMRFAATTSQCSVCGIPSNHRQVLEHLNKNINQLSDIELIINKGYKKQSECLANCTVLLEYLTIKTKMLSLEKIKYQRFIDGLIFDLLKNHKAIFRSGKNMIFLKMNENHENGCSAEGRFMDSIINSQKQIIENLTAKHKEVLIMRKTMELFSKVL